MDKILKAISYFFENLSSKPQIGGLQITNLALQYVAIQKNKVVTHALRLPPGILHRGTIADSAALFKSLRDLHDLITGGNRRSRIIKVIVSLPADLVYTQRFTVPNISAEKLDEASRLNLQMISPIPPEEAYMSSQVLYETPERYELLGAFANKKLVEQYRSLLAASGFNAVIFEFPSLALARVIQMDFRQAGEGGAIIVLQISAEGLDIFLFKNNNLYFDYFRSWQSIQGESQEISKELFQSVIVEEMQKVINFTSSRLRETPQQVLLIVPTFEVEIKNLIEHNFGIKTEPFKLRTYSLAPVWYPALGSAIRGNWDWSGDKFLALGAEDLASILYKERFISFIIFWRNILVTVLGFFLTINIAIAGLLVRQQRTLANRFQNLVTGPFEQEIASLRQQAKDFNNLVSAVATIKAETPPWHTFFSKIKTIANREKVVIEGLNVQSLNAPINLLGRAPDNNTVVKFKNALVNDKNFKDVDLPLSQISVAADNSVIFNISFMFSPTP